MPEQHSRFSPSISFSRSIRYLLPLALMLILAACGGLAGEPEIVATLPPATTVAQDIGYPVQPPDLALGAQIYAQHCTQCHGINGQGDGALVLSGEVTRPRDFTDPATTSEQRPTEWFNTITNGRIENLMPPWKDALSESERWAVAMYTYTLPYTDEQLALGEQVWTANCAECHGESGRGDGPEAAQLTRPISDLTLQSEMVTLSDQQIFNIVTEGIGQMPAFAESLDENQRRAVVAHTRSLSVAEAGTVQTATTPEPTSESGIIQGTISGTVTNGTAASTIPSGLVVTLGIFDGTTIETLQTPVNPDGTYRFENVPILQDNLYSTRTIYRDRLFFSEPILGDLSQANYDMPLKIYELTEDPSVVTISRVETRAAPLNLTDFGSGLEIIQEFTFTNNSDRAFTTNRSITDQTYASLLVLLPPGSVFLTFDNATRYLPVQEEYALIDTLPVIPGNVHQIQVTYFLPYTESAIIEQVVNYDFEGTMRTLIAPNWLEFISNQIPFIGEEDSEGRTFQIHEGTVSIPRGDVIRYELNGSIVRDFDDANIISANTLIPLLLFLAGVSLLITSFVLYRRSRQTVPVQQDKNRLMDALVRQIAELDQAHEAGQINHDLYHHQRNQLKARLAELMEKERGES